MEAIQGEKRIKGADSIDLLESKLALVRTLTEGHANCINTPKLNHAESERRSDNNDAHERKITHG